MTFLQTINLGSNLSFPKFIFNFTSSVGLILLPLAEGSMMPVCKSVLFHWGCPCLVRNLSHLRIVLSH